MSGERLATALRTSRKGASGQLARPAVVTLASCYSGSVGSVTGVGASIAHALHADGIPMVIASQFPLSFGGSVRMVEMLYEGLLSGEDPRRLLIDLRRTLHTQFPDTHDWASVTAYSSLPPNFDRQLAVVQIQRARRSIDVALDLADEVVARVERGDRRSRQVTANRGRQHGGRRRRHEIEVAMKRVRESRARLAQLARSVAFAARAHRRAARQRRQARGGAGVRDAQAPSSTVSPRPNWTGACGRCWSARASSTTRPSASTPLRHWAVVQYISLSVVMRHGGRLTQGADAANGEIGKLWALAEVQSLRDLSSVDYARRAWALGNLIELYLLAPVINEVKQAHQHPGPPPDWRALATHHAKELAKMARPGAFEIFSTRRQIVRYLDLYVELCPSGALEAAVAIAEQVATLLPAQLPEDIS